MYPLLIFEAYGITLLSAYSPPKEEIFQSQDISVGIMTGYGLDCRCLIPGEDKRYFSCP
jgi:hypothetical protein